MAKAAKNLRSVAAVWRGTPQAFASRILSAASFE
jgi:hypothetical protein